jgi:hypothetical protein
MLLKDQKIFDTIERLKEQYHIFSSNNYIKSYLFEADISKSDWMDIEDLLNSNQYYDATGYDLDKLYDQLLTFSRFLTRLVRDIIPRMQNEVNARANTLSKDNKVIFKMTVNNAPGNVKTLEEFTVELFNGLKQLDKAAHGDAKMCLHSKNYLKELEQKLSE